jgi:hypothetical protein
MSKDSDPHSRQQVSWGEPAMIVQAAKDKVCSRCGLSRAAGFDLGIENGRVFGARCPADAGGCGWSF